MTNRATKTELDFTEAQIVDALRDSGWNIPVPDQQNKPKIDVKAEGVRFSVSWSDEIPEAQTP